MTATRMGLGIGEAPGGWDRGIITRPRNASTRNFLRTFVAAAGSMKMYGVPSEYRWCADEIGLRARNASVAEDIMSDRDSFGKCGTPRAGHPSMRWAKGLPAPPLRW